MRSLHNQVQYLEKQLLKSKDPGYPLFVAKVPTGMNFVEKYPADLCFIRFNDIFSVFRMQMLHFSVVRLVALSLSSQIVKEGTPTIAIMDPFYMRESIICNAGDRAIATGRSRISCWRTLKRAPFSSLTSPSKDKFCTLIVVHPQHSHAIYLDSGRNRKKEYTHIKGVLNDALTGFDTKTGPLKMPTTYVVYKGRVPGVYDDWEDCRRQVHRFSGNNYKGYPTRVEAEGRYARYLAGEMRDMRRNRMKTMAFVMMLIVTMVMFYVIVV
ncbi:hypothetical protein QYE76_029070 [Lolium multiflorum]|uniref:Ribonuclease H1 N-terminal domain-containing protein n=1 Tax=Lolium multiflorum TaxID=4521 RepID=A0AAD8QPS4_LOLMU|nr:hypothetical protein QYE76_029070 [Lolium multiflorum]